MTQEYRENQTSFHADTDAHQIHQYCVVSILAQQLSLTP